MPYRHRRNFDGEADSNLFIARDHLGNATNINRVIFPILKVVNRRWNFIGTGFFITSNGLFVTAKHVLQDAINREMNVDQLYIIQWLADSSYIIRNILKFGLHPYADIGIGFVQPLVDSRTGQNLSTDQLILTNEQPSIEETIFSYAYPKTIVTDDQPWQSIYLYPGHYIGRLKEYYPTGRDRTFLPYPCYRTSIIIHDGASGGPVFDSNGRVFGINSTGYEGSRDISFVSRISDIFACVLSSVQIQNSSPIPMTILELSKRGLITFNPPLAITE